MNDPTDLVDTDHNGGPSNANGKDGTWVCKVCELQSSGESSEDSDEDSAA